MKQKMLTGNKKLLAIVCLLFLMAEVAICLFVGGWRAKLILSFVAVVMAVFTVLDLLYGRKKIVDYIKSNKKVMILFVLCLLFSFGLCVKGIQYHGLSTLYGRYLAIVEILLLPMVLLGMLGIYVWKLSIWKLYLIVGGLAGLAMMLALPLGAVPDEVSHINSAYRVSNILLGVKEGSSGIMMRGDDAAMAMASYARHAYSDANSFETYIGQIMLPLQNGELVSTPVAFNQPLYAYTFSALGITLGRLLNFGSYSTLLLGRIFNFAIYMVITTYALKLIPWAKIFTFVLLLMPMAVQQGMSFSYDVFVNGLSILLISFALKIMFSNTEDKLRKWEICIMGIASVFLFPLKGKAYFLISLLPWIVLLYKKHPWSETAIVRFQKYLIIGIVLSVIAVTVWGVTGAANYQYTPNLLTYNNSLNEPVAGYSIGYFIAHPFDIVSIAKSTYNMYYQFYVESFVGETLAWLDLGIPHAITVITYILLALASLRRMNSTLYPTKNIKVFLCVIGLLTCIFIFVGMLLGWSDIGSGVIQGVQGRYFLPVALLLMPLLNFKSLQIDRRADNAIALVSILTIFYTVEYLMTRI